jgi:hypothetical protein
MYFLNYKGLELRLSKEGFVTAEVMASSSVLEATSGLRL